MERIISGLFSLLLGLVGLWTGFKQLKNRAVLNRWSTTKGKVIERGTYKPNTPGSGPPAFRHAPLVKYVYEVDGKEFFNNSIHPKRIQLPARNTLKWAQKRADSFPDDVTVHYNPADPGESYLIQTKASILYTVVAVSGLLVLIGLLILLTL